jgi:hypothetical protein
VLRAKGEQAEADAAIETAVRIWERKGNIAAAARVRVSESTQTS